MNRQIITGLVIALLSLYACNNTVQKPDEKDMRAEAQKEYVSLLEREMKKDQQVDSIFYGIHLKMTKNSFFDYCNEMFRKKVFTGGYDYQVAIDFPNEFSKPVTLKFYPTFEKPFISRLQCRFQFVNANLYNKEERADVLAAELAGVMMEWYGGNPFIKILSQHPLKGPEYVKIDANRKITLSEADNGVEVLAVYDDLKPLY